MGYLITTRTADIKVGFDRRIRRLTADIYALGIYSTVARIKVELLETMEEIKANKTSMTVSDTKELLFRCAACLISESTVSKFKPFHLSSILILMNRSVTTTSCAASSLYRTRSSALQSFRLESKFGHGP